MSYPANTEVRLAEFEALYEAAAGELRLELIDGRIYAEPTRVRPSAHPTTAGYAGKMSELDFEVSLAAFERLERAASEEVTVELINGRVYVVPAPDGEHDDCAVEIGDQIREHHPDLRLYQERALAVPGYRTGRARPDGVLAPRRHFRGQPTTWSSTTGVVLVLEITSGRERDAEVDRVEKRDAYAQAEIPLYLLVDRHRSEVTIFWDPAQGEYQHSQTAKIGAVLYLPAPLELDLETSQLF
ncbi:MULTISPECIES: Uma2 family endonuclease [unclassified Nocardia]|uniref:Uma2 family endonuclease n=1 Tax=unclassified Nocardia TaxID=2637762 RepID=UPI001CE3EE5D|nr:MULTISPECIES: Uma2 family endonuclease [unclassified Nocardia]